MTRSVITRITAGHELEYAQQKRHASILHIVKQQGQCNTKKQMPSHKDGLKFC